MENRVIGEEQQEYEAFLDAFQKPTLIYSFLKQRHETQPLFLHRNLSYRQPGLKRLARKKNVPGTVDRLSSALLSSLRSDTEQVLFSGPCLLSLHSIRGGICEDLARYSPDTAQVEVCLVGRDTSSSVKSNQDLVCLVADSAARFVWSSASNTGQETSSSLSPCSRSSTSSMSTDSGSAVLELSIEIRQARLSDLLQRHSCQCWYLRLKVVVKSKSVQLTIAPGPGNRACKPGHATRQEGHSSTPVSPRPPRRRSRSQASSATTSRDSSPHHRPSTRSAGFAADPTAAARRTRSVAAQPGTPPSASLPTRCRTRSTSAATSSSGRRKSAFLPDVVAGSTSGGVKRPGEASPCRKMSRGLRRLVQEQPANGLQCTVVSYKAKQSGKRISRLSSPASGKARRELDSPTGGTSGSLAQLLEDSESEGESDGIPTHLLESVEHRVHTLTAEMPLCDSKQGCLLFPGGYELICSQTVSTTTTAPDSLPTTPRMTAQIPDDITMTSQPSDHGAEHPAMAENAPRPDRTSQTSFGPRSRSTVSQGRALDVEAHPGTGGRQRTASSGTASPSATVSPPSLEPPGKRLCSASASGRSGPAPGSSSSMPIEITDESKASSCEDSELDLVPGGVLRPTAAARSPGPVSIQLEVSWPEGEPQLGRRPCDSVRGDSAGSGDPSVAAGPSGPVPTPSASSAAPLARAPRRHSHHLAPPALALSLATPPKIVLNLVHNGTSHQQVAITRPGHCPWCSRSCRHIAAFMHHVRASHPRFNFHVLCDSGAYTLNVSVNESYDRVYSGDPHELFCLLTFNPAFPPQRRHPHTKVWVERPAYHRGVPICRNDLNNDDDLEFTNIKDSCHSDRVYFHSASCLPLLPAEMEEDSEDEMTPSWLVDKTRMMLDEFTDVNRGEKAVMNLWNTFTLEKFQPLADSQIAEVSLAFVESCWQEIAAESLSNNLLLHLANLRDFGLLTPAGVHRCYMRYRELSEST